MFDGGAPKVVGGLYVLCAVGFGEGCGVLHETPTNYRKWWRAAHQHTVTRETISMTTEVTCCVAPVERTNLRQRMRNELEV